jgi:O-antigen/teichoic acid export membrane protein
MASVYPILSRQIPAGGGAAQRTLDATARAFVALGLPLAAGGLLVAPELARVAGGDEFAAAADPLRLLLCAAVLAYLSGLCGYALIAGGRERTTLKLSVAALVFNLALNVALAPAYGPTAAAAIALASEALLLGGGWWLVGRELDLRPALTGLWRTALAAGLMAAVVWPLRERSLALTVPLGMVVYGAALWALGGVDRRTLEALRG